MKTLAKWLVVLVVLAGAGGAAWWYFLATPQAATVPTTVSPSRGDIEQTVLASGVLQANSLVSVGAEVSGRIEAVHVSLGQDVKKGDLIAEIDSLDQENAVKTAQAVLAGIEAQKRSQEASLVKATATLKRNQQLNANSLVSQTDLETAQAAVDSAQAQIDQLDAQIAQAELSVESAELNVARTKIVAPNDGTVVALLVEQGQTVNANSTIPTIVKIADLDTMVIKAEISEADVVRVQAGQRVYFTILGEPDVQIDAELREVEPAPTSINSDTSSNDSAVYYNGLFDVPNPDHKLRISMTAQVTIVLAEARDALTLSSALVTRKDPRGNSVVMVYDPDTKEVEPRRIEVGLNNNIMAEIKSGLDESDQVVTSATAGGRGGQAGGGAPGGNRFGGGGLLGGGRP
ncbi:efflux RND transporter periplasmic adaptor subunit [Devosia sp. BSSL-BM10]|uniref:Efflux RND transporter periplasmic adaptor subunit n=1 Tax=Devosia litorisediminis TaxID=2829817 RepID=A0A942E4K1_9HYPH|nr:efflux RND transporter periplasmic adaptor subunit [Devosia litorisediminis]MBS3847331.1 efflux RND transporter periplasmic adaptor subunit [Devosia litorisediminis]